MSRKTEVKQAIPETQAARRKFMQIASTVGIGAALAARSQIVEAGEALTAEGLQDRLKGVLLAQASSRRKREFTIRMPVSGSSEETEIGFPVGYWEFARDLQERTDGRIEVQLIGRNGLCTEITCAQRFSTGTVQAFGSSSQNASLTYPFLTAVDFPFLFPSRANMYHFLYSSRGDQVFRKPLREKFDYEFLWTLAEGRAIFLGRGWRDRSDVRLPEHLGKAKIRVTGSPMARISLNQFGANPIPLDWAETYEGLKSGVVDGMENFASAAPAYGMTPALSQVVALEFFAGFEHAAISRRFMNKLPDDLREAVMESAFHTQQWTQHQLEKALVDVNGLTAEPKPGTIFAKDQVRVVIPTASEKKAWEDLASPEKHPAPYAEWRDKLGKMAGNIDIYAEIHKIAREIPADTSPTSVEPRRWWKS